MAGRSVAVVKNTGINFLNQVVRLISRMALSVITARLLGPKNLGVFSLIGWFMGISELFVNLGIAFGVTKYVAELHGRKDAESIGALINLSLIMKIGAACFSAFVLIVFSGTIAGFFKIPEWQNLFIIGALALIPSGISGIFSSALSGVQKYGYSLKVNLVFTPIAFMASVLVLLKGYGVVGLVLVSLAVSVVRLFANAAAAAGEGLLNTKLRLADELRKKAIRFNIGVTIMNFLDAVVWQRSEVFFLGKFRPIQEVGFYSLAYGFTSMTVTFFSSAISSVLVPIQSRAYGEKNVDQMKRIYHKSIKYIAMASFPIAAGGIALADPLIRILYGTQYLPVAGILSVLFLSSAGARIGSSMASLMYSAELVGVKVKFAVVYSILNILLDFLLIPKYGIWGAVIANSGTQFLGICIGPFVIHHFFKFDFPVPILLRVASASGLMAGFVLLVNAWIGIAHFYSLLITIILGAVVFVLGLVIFGVLDREDTRLMKDVYDRLPPVLKGRYVSLLYKLDHYVR